jgi:hypothetical protein
MASEGLTSIEGKEPSMISICRELPTKMIGHATSITLELDLETIEI